MESPQSSPPYLKTKNLFLSKLGNLKSFVSVLKGFHLWLAEDVLKKATDLKDNGECRESSLLLLYSNQRRIEEAKKILEFS